MVTWEIVKKLAPWILATLVIGSLIWWVSQANLASHAARLDRSLEEGRRMVAELSATLRQRDDQLRAVSKQLENDRSLFMTGDKK